MNLLFITTNKHKVLEVAAVLKKYNIEIEQRAVSYPEDKEKDMAEIAESSARSLANKLNRPVITEDTGLYFEAYNSFPGALPKFVFQGIGFEGIFKLLQYKDRGAYFKTVLAYCKPNEEPKLFEAEMRGTITNEIVLPEADAMPYDHIFIPDGHDTAIVEMALDKKNSISQRGQAAGQLGEYLKNNN